MITGPVKFKDRIEAGEMLAAKLEGSRKTNSLVLAIPRGGVPVGYIISAYLGLPLEVLLSKKIGHPVQPEFAIGAVTSETMIIDPEYADLTDHIKLSIADLRAKLKDKYIQLGSRLDDNMIKGRTIILTDDGAATGKTLIASISLLRKAEPAEIIVAIPVSSPEAFELLSANADKVVCLHTDQDFYGVGQFYEDFEQVSDEEVRDYLARARRKFN